MLQNAIDDNSTLFPAMDLSQEATSHYLTYMVSLRPQWVKSDLIYTSSGNKIMNTKTITVKVYIHAPTSMAI